MKSEIDLRGFYPEYMEIVEVEQTNGELYVEMESVTTMARCPVCGMESSKRHSGYTRKSIRDLPILGNGVKLLVNAQMYFCINPKCYVVTFTEDLPGITGNRGQWTERCETLIIAIAANTNCESAARICREMKINISGDTVIRMMLRKVREKKYFGEAIGVDDFAIKKGQNYGTMICDMETHQPIALLLGRDGNELKQWLKKNKQVKIVSRDRAGSYAAAISEILPDAIQVADRFHIYHNLLIAVKEAINGILPDKVLITDEPTNIETEKKLSLRAIEAQEKEIRRKEIILEARRLFQEEKLSKVEICTKLGITYKRLRKYLAGNPDMVCKNGNTGQSRGSILDRYHNVIAELLDESKQYKEIHQTLFEYGCKVGYTTLFDYCIKMFGNKCETIKYHSNREQHYVTRKQILKYIWSHKPLEEYDKQWVFSLYPELFIIRDSVSGFRHAVEQMNEILLKDWIHQEANSLIPRIKSFCNGILRDLEPVLNSVRYTTNNAFLEGNVNRLKMIKRTMYGRAGYGLLGAKVLNGIFRV